MNNNTESTRYYSDKHEKSVCNALNAYQQSNSGAGKFRKGDVYNSKASLLIECKTCMTDKSSFSIKQDWILKNKDEAFSPSAVSNVLLAADPNILKTLPFGILMNFPSPYLNK